MIFSFLMIIGSCVIAIWDGFRSEYSFWQFFLRFELILRDKEIKLLEDEADKLNVRILGADMIRFAVKKN